MPTTTVPEGVTEIKKIRALQRKALLDVKAAGDAFATAVADARASLNFEEGGPYSSALAFIDRISGQINPMFSAEYPNLINSYPAQTE